MHDTYVDELEAYENGVRLTKRKSDKSHMILNLELPESKHQAGAQMIVFHDLLMNRVSRVPGVRAAGDGRIRIAT